MIIRSVLHPRKYPVLLLLIGLSLCLAGLGGCGAGKKGPAKGPQMGTPTVVVAQVTRQGVPIYGDYVATIDPTTGAESVEIRARVEAVLLNQCFQEGMPVKKGQVMFLLDPKPFQANLDSANASLAKAKADLTYAVENVEVVRAQADVTASQAQLINAAADEARLRSLAAQKAVPQQDYDNALTALRVAKATVTAKQAVYRTTVLNQKVSIQQAKAEIESAKAAIEIARINLSYCTITTPIEGVAGTRLVPPGNIVGHGENTLLTVVTDLDPLRVNFAVSEKDYLRIKKQLIAKKFTIKDTAPLELMLADGSKYPLLGKLIIAEPTIDPKTGTLSLVGQFPNPQTLLRPGIFGRIRMVVDYTPNAVLIPQKAISVLQSAKIAYVVGPDNKVSLRTLLLGDSVGTMAIVQEGVKPGERVVVEGQLKIQPGMVVNPVTQPVTKESSKQ